MSDLSVDVVGLKEHHTQDGPLWYALHSSDPTGETQNFAEISYPKYRRVLVELKHMESDGCWCVNLPRFAVTTTKYVLTHVSFGAMETGEGEVKFVIAITNKPTIHPYLRPEFVFDLCKETAI